MGTRIMRSDAATTTMRAALALLVTAGIVLTAGCSGRGADVTTAGGGEGDGGEAGGADGGVGVHGRRHLERGAREGAHRRHDVRRRADRALYRAKAEGRNRVSGAAA